MSRYGMNGEGENLLASGIAYYLPSMFFLSD